MILNDVALEVPFHAVELIPGAAALRLFAPAIAPVICAAKTGGWDGTKIFSPVGLAHPRVTAAAPPSSPSRIASLRFRCFRFTV